MNILHLENGGPRSAPIFNQALLGRYEFEASRDYFQLGVLKKRKCGDIKTAIRNCDLILNGCPDYVDMLDGHWRKVIHYDFSDSPILTDFQTEIRSKAAKYFKRSRFDTDRVQRNDCYPLDYCALDEYYSEPVERDLDVGCFFSYGNPFLGQRRRNLLDCLRDWSPANSVIGSEDHGREARNAVAAKSEANPFIRYRDMLKRCKIVFTAYPEHWEGDSRTWEAFASGALVFKDEAWSKLPHYPIAGKHCEVFDAKCKDSIGLAVDKAVWYLRNEDIRRKVAAAGFDLVRRYHRPVNRLAYVLGHPALL